MAKRDLLRNPLDFETTVKAFLQTPAPPVGTPGSRKEAEGAEAENRKKRKGTR
jgi:hypothetical protein